MLIADWSMKRVFFLYLLEKAGGKITQPCLVIRLLSLCNRELLLKIFCNNGVSFRDSQRGIYRRNKRQERKRKREEKHGEYWKNVFKKSGRMKATTKKRFQ